MAKMLHRALLLRSVRGLFTPSLTHRTPFLSPIPAVADGFPINNRRQASHVPLQSIRAHSSTHKSTADEKIEEITELYATAQDEFEIAMEETEKVSVYAAEDRKAAREELTRVQDAFREVVEGQDRDLAEEVKRRIGQRIRELEQGVAAMEELAMNQD